MKVLTENALRCMGLDRDKKEFCLSPGMVITPAAREYLADRKIRLISGKETCKTIKTEFTTCLHGTELVEKTHPRIRFRGSLDKLLARLLLLQKKCDVEKLNSDLSDLYQYVNRILIAEVKEEPVGELKLFGFCVSEIHEMSHKVKKYFGIPHPFPTVSMSEMALEINLLRTEIRETELYAAAVFGEEDSLGILLALNRLSSGAYVIFCRMESGYYGQQV